MRLMNIYRSFLKKSFKNKLHRSIDKILLAHRNSKLFLIMMSGPFLITVYVIKYALKILFFYYIYKKTGGKEKEKTVVTVPTPVESQSNSS